YTDYSDKAEQREFSRWSVDGAPPRAFPHNPYNLQKPYVLPYRSIHRGRNGRDPFPFPTCPWTLRGHRWMPSSETRLCSAPCVYVTWPADGPYPSALARSCPWRPALHTPHRQARRSSVLRNTSPAVFAVLPCGCGAMSSRSSVRKILSKSRPHPTMQTSKTQLKSPTPNQRQIARPNTPIWKAAVKG